MSEWEPLLPTGLPPEIQTVLDHATNAVTQLQNLVQLVSDPLKVALEFLSSDVHPALSLLQSVLEESRGLLMQLGDTSLYWLTLHHQRNNMKSISEKIQSQCLHVYTLASLAL